MSTREWGAPATQVRVTVPMAQVVHWSERRFSEEGTSSGAPMMPMGVPRGISASALAETEEVDISPAALARRAVVMLPRGSRVPLEV